MDRFLSDDIVSYQPKSSRNAVLLGLSVAFFHLFPHNFPIARSGLKATRLSHIDINVAAVVLVGVLPTWKGALAMACMTNTYFVVTLSVVAPSAVGFLTWIFEHVGTKGFTTTTTRRRWLVTRDTFEGITRGFPANHTIVTKDIVWSPVVGVLGVTRTIFVPFLFAKEVRCCLATAWAPILTPIYTSTVIIWVGEGRTVGPSLILFW